MNCMKCGREMTQQQAFCDTCLEEMEKYPVKPGTVVHLPRRREEPSQKKSHRRKTAPGPEEQVKSLKRLVRVLLATLLVATALLGAAGYFAVVHLLEEEPVLLPGQNYSSVTTDELPMPE